MLSALLLGNPFALVLLAPVLLAFWALPRSATDLAGALLAMAHLVLALVIVRADAPAENRALAPVTMFAVDLGLLAACALTAPLLRRWRTKSRAA